jgi:hypothetical protein
MLIAFLLLVLVCLVIMVVATFLFPAPLKAEAKSLVWENWPSRCALSAARACPTTASCRR